MNQAQIAILSFYVFHNIMNPTELMQNILLIGLKKRLKGTVLIAKEGINGTLSGSKESLEFTLSSIKELIDVSPMSKYHYHAVHPFRKLRVKIKDEIIAMGDLKLDVKNLSGDYIQAKEWDRFIDRGDVVLVDTRNKYEVEEGTFQGAINPNTDSFNKFPAWASQNHALLKDKKIGMFCTGGVRCEKSTAYLKSLGYQKLFQLKGGILEYLAQTGNINKKWQGSCFVFDDRIKVDDKLNADNIMS